MSAILENKAQADCEVEASVVSRRKPVEVHNIRPAGQTAQVVTVTGGAGGYRRTPCGGCPWVQENAGDFPAEAFLHSANTAHDMSTHRFACHESGVHNPATCAGFLLRGAEHNLSIRLARMEGVIGDDVRPDGRALFEDYRSMAIAHGVDPHDPAIRGCR